MYGLETEELWIENPLLYTDVEKYIWISDTAEKHREAQNLFYYLLKKQIYIRGFVTDSPSMVGLKMFHKYIYGTDVLEKENAIYFVDLEADVSGISVRDKMQYIKSVSADMDKDNVIVWGSGNAGEQVFRVLERNGIRVKYFVDSDVKKEGLLKCGLPVYLPEKLDSESESFVIVEAMDQWKELDNMICDKYERRFYYPCFQYQKFRKNITPRITCELAGEKKTVLLLDSDIFFYMGDKKVYVYGLGDVEREAAKYLKLLDYDFKGFLVDNAGGENEDESGLIKYIEDVLNEKDFIIQVYDDIKAGKLDMLGLKYFEHYIYGMYDQDISIKKSKVLDINLGHSYISQCMYPGFMVYEKHSGGGIKL